MEKFNPVSFTDVAINKGFWRNRIDINENVTIYSVRDRFRDTGRFEAFKFNWKEGSDLPQPHIFWDSDIAKWIESVAFILAKKEDKELYENVEEVISLMEQHQCEDGYFNIAHTVVFPEKRFKVRDNHELYCLGHFIEAAVAWKIHTGCDRLIKIVDKYIDLVIRVFCEEKSAVFVTPGHEEIELALIKLFRLTGNKKYLDLCVFFINERGYHPDEHDARWCNSAYNQSHKPVREQKEAMGHCVRACYLYSAMADLYKETGDKELLSACKAIFRDITERKMYISGGIGSSHHGEAFTVAYDLPPDTAYTETCAAISLMMFADRMKDIELDSVYADTVERIIYNGFISGISLDGRAFFYENPLEINLSDRGRHTSIAHEPEHLSITERVEVFSCSCCPPNVTRYIETMGERAYSVSDDAFAVHQFISSVVKAGECEIEVKTEYPKNGKLTLTAKGMKGKSLFVRIPFWCDEFTSDRAYAKEKGYARYEVKEDVFTLEIDMNMRVKFYHADTRVRACAGKTAVMYGPVLYCAEAVDNGEELFNLSVLKNGNYNVKYSEEYFANVIEIDGLRREYNESLYSSEDDYKDIPVRIKLIPYFAFANRGESDMTVWLRDNA
ncbi:MAG: glycoside hydrolase family 127 protein [Clostridia bacterium]|nr:glycoside hydrolase family 127 protein [Clostridia bacterium]